MTVLPVTLLAGWLACVWVADGLAQIVGDEAEMERLRARAEDAIAGDDPEGAAMSMGRAALMAAELAKRQPPGLRQRYFRGAEALFRSQEHAYRSMALFRRAGGQPPASSGACGGLSLAESQVQEAMKFFNEKTEVSEEDPKTASSLARFKETTEDWVTVIASMRHDFQCP